MKAVGRPSVGTSPVSSSPGWLRQVSGVAVGLGGMGVGGRGVEVRVGGDRNRGWFRGGGWRAGPKSPKKQDEQDELSCLTVVHPPHYTRPVRGVAQLAAHCVWDAGVVGSSPTTPTQK